MGIMRKPHGGRCLVLGSNSNDPDCGGWAASPLQCSLMSSSHLKLHRSVSAGDATFIYLGLSLA